ncbi:hypothetical protein [Methylotenera sp. 1P/1]|uniref:hypothetical protein n=1 Tax=Methylotenera sp. 1P/1 TaxID=1131551 RepID=UPI000381C742|nr:hypothetical protein [Methylotenera sp. 1P/1]
MLHKLVLHVVLVVLFAFTQIGAATHEISHFSNTTQQTLPDQHTSPDQCSQCLAYAQSAAGTLVHTFTIPLLQATFQLAVAFVQPHLSTAPATYRARAPPVYLN